MLSNRQSTVSPISTNRLPPTHPLAERCPRHMSQAHTASGLLNLQSIYHRVCLSPRQQYRLSPLFVSVLSCTSGTPPLRTTRNPPQIPCYTDTITPPSPHMYATLRPGQQFMLSVPPSLQKLPLRDLSIAHRKPKVRLHRRASVSRGWEWDCGVKAVE